MLEVEGLRKRYGDKVALDGVSFTVPPGVMFGFVGANGAGKTTTMRIIMGVTRADGGDVRWRGAGLDLSTRQRFGYLPEERGLYPSMRVSEQIEYFARLHGMSAADARRAAQYWIDRLDLGRHRNDEVSSLSLGNQQRVQLAVAVVHDPQLLVLDEPFSGLDPLAVDTLAGVLADKAAGGVPGIFSSHQLELVERLCHSVGIIAAGRMVAVGPVAELRQRGTTRLRVVVSGASPGWADRLPGKVVEAVNDSEVLVEAEDDQAVLQAAVRAGRVVHFGQQQPTLAEIFREAVA